MVHLIYKSHLKAVCVCPKKERFRFCSQLIITNVKWAFNFLKKLRKIPKKFPWIAKKCLWSKKKCVTIPKNMPEDSKACFTESFKNPQKTCLSISFNKESRSTRQLSGTSLGCNETFWGSSGIFFGISPNFFGISQWFLGYKKSNNRVNKGGFYVFKRFFVLSNVNVCHISKDSDHVNHPFKPGVHHT